MCMQRFEVGSTRYEGGDVIVSLKEEEEEGALDPW